MLTMEDSESTTRQRTTGRDESPETENTSTSNKPLHRFVQREPRCFGVVILMFGCAELLMGFMLTRSREDFYLLIYFPFCLGALFVVCGFLSIYTEFHPSKRMVTVCLSMYVVTILAIVVFIIFRTSNISYLFYKNRVLAWVELILCVSSLCVSILLIFLSIVARFALKSTHTQVIIQQIPLSQTSQTTSD